MKRLAVIGAGWAGLAAAVEATRLGARVTLFEMASQPGGRARDLSPDDPDGLGLDNGQHIAIGAYRDTLALMATVGVAAEAVFLRCPLALVDARGRGLRLPGGEPNLSFARGVLAHGTWSWRERLALLGAAARWRRGGFRCDDALTVDALVAGLPERVRQDLVAPLCVAALNTPSRTASARVFLRVLGDALGSGRGGSDLLLPKQPLGSLLPKPALAWLAGHGAQVRLGARVGCIERAGGGWRVDGASFDAAVFDAVVVATSAREAARLIQPIDATWSARATGLAYEPIVTVYAQATGARLPEPMLMLAGDEATRPAQFVFDRGQLGGPAGLLAFVISGAAPWVARGAEATAEATLAQAASELGPLLPAPLCVIRTVTEKRATFACTPGLVRPSSHIATALVACGDHVEGPYPATLEGAVQSGLAAARGLRQ